MHNDLNEFQWQSFEEIRDCEFIDAILLGFFGRFLHCLNRILCLIHVYLIVSDLGYSPSTISDSRSPKAWFKIESRRDVLQEMIKLLDSTIRKCHFVMLQESLLSVDGWLNFLSWKQKWRGWMRYLNDSISSSQTSTISAIQASNKLLLLSNNNHQVTFKSVLHRSTGICPRFENTSRTSIPRSL